MIEKFNDSLFREIVSILLDLSNRHYSDDVRKKFIKLKNASGVTLYDGLDEISKMDVSNFVREAVNVSKYYERPVE